MKVLGVILSFLLLTGHLRALCDTSECMASCCSVATEPGVPSCCSGPTQDTEEPVCACCEKENLPQFVFSPTPRPVRDDVPVDTGCVMNTASLIGYTSVGFHLADSFGRAPPWFQSRRERLARYQQMLI